MLNYCYIVLFQNVRKSPCFKIQDQVRQQEYFKYISLQLTEAALYINSTII